MTTLSDKIRSYSGPSGKNPWQGGDKKVLFICSMGLLRSATAARMYAGQFNTRAAGTSADALVPLSPLLIAWADEIVFVNKINYDEAVEKFGENSWNHARCVVLFIDDQHAHMDPILVEKFKKQYVPVI